MPDRAASMKAGARSQRLKVPEADFDGLPTLSTSVQVLMRLGSVLVAQVRVPSAKRTRPMARVGPSRS